jgi:hypothetical protein
MTLSTNGLKRTTVRMTLTQNHTAKKVKKSMRGMCDGAE